MELYNKRIVITRPRAQAEAFARQIAAAGAVPVYLPVIEIQPLADAVILDRALGKLACYDWVVFTSTNGVEAVWERLTELGLPGLPAGLRVAAIGPKTAAALQQRGVQPAFMPDEYIAEAILPGLGDVRGRWILLPRADLARPALPLAILAAGGIPHEIAAYHTIPAEPDPAGLQALREGVDIITFTSSSTVRNFVALAHGAGLDPVNLPAQPRLACIGPITASTAADEGLPVDLVADEYTIEGLLAAIAAA